MLNKKRFRLKVYTDKGLITSHYMNDETRIQQALEELAIITTIKAIYMTDGKNSKLIPFTQNKSTRPMYYTRSDNTQTKTLSIHPRYYPMIAHFADGSKEVISL